MPEWYAPRPPTAAENKVLYDLATEHVGRGYPMSIIREAKRVFTFEPPAGSGFAGIYDRWTQMVGVSAEMLESIENGTIERKRGLHAVAHEFSHSWITIAPPAA